jgi:hypothetical protein
LSPRANGAGLCRRRLFAAVFAVAASLLPARADASGFRIFSARSREWPSPAQSSRQFTLGPCCDRDLATDPPLAEALSLDLHFPDSPAFDPPAQLGAPLPPTPFVALPGQPRRFLIGVASLGAIAGSYLNAYTDGSHHDFHFTNEGYWGRNTYVGGGDKASHLVSYYSVARLLEGVYESFDLHGERAYTLASATSFVAGLATELGDGTNKYGFSHEDLVIDTVGAASAFVLARYRLNDLIGFRAGIVAAPDTPEEIETDGTGKDYTREIYTADLKLAGLSKRLDRGFGPARFLLVSMTYGVKGYPYAPPELRERQVGLEVGLNVAELARAAGVPENRWWGRMLLIVLDIVRFPYTAVGVRYDINHRKWIGPDTGQTFSFP